MSATSPGRSRPLLLRLLLIFAGYTIAVAAAVPVTVAIMLAPTALPDGGAQGPIFATLAQMMPAAFVVGFFWTYICAWPGFIVAVAVGQRRRWHGWLPFAAAGVANVVPSLAIYGVLAGSPFAMPMMIFASFFGGFAGGAAYWAAAGRHMSIGPVAA